jgi:hypothetical protein
MSATTEEVQREIDTNLEYFLQQLPKLLMTHRGQYALMHRSEVVGFFPNAASAQEEGRKRFADELFSVQKVVEVQVDLGFFSHALHLG